MSEFLHWVFHKLRLSVTTWICIDQLDNRLQLSSLNMSRKTKIIRGCKWTCHIGFLKKMLYMSPFACTYLFIFRNVDYFSFLSSCDNVQKYKQTKLNIWYRNIWNKSIEHNEYIFQHSSSKICTVIIGLRTCMSVNSLSIVFSPK